MVQDQNLAESQEYYITHLDECGERIHIPLVLQDGAAQRGHHGAYAPAGVAL